VPKCKKTFADLIDKVYTKGVNPNKETLDDFSPTLPGMLSSGSGM
jgi:hypothetical protein